MEESYKRTNGPVVFWLIALVVLAAAAVFAAPFVGAISWAVVLSVLTYPVYKRLKKSLSKLPDTWAENLAATVVTLMAAFIILLPLGLFGTMAGIQIYDFAIASSEGRPDGEEQFSLDRIADYLDEQTSGIKASVGADDFSIKDWFNRNRQRIGDSITEPLVAGGKAIVITILTLVIALLTTFYFLKDGHKLRGPVIELIPLPREETIDVLERLRDTIWAVFQGIILVALLQGLVGGIAYAIVGIPGAFVWGLVTFMLCIIPLLGSPMVYLPFAAILAINGEYTRAAILLAIGLLVISNIDNLLRPFVIGGKTGMHAIAVFFALLGGVLAMGPIGVVVGPLVLTLLLAVFDVLRRRREHENVPVSP